MADSGWAWTTEVSSPELSPKSKQKPSKKKKSKSNRSRPNRSGGGNRANQQQRQSNHQNHQSQQNQQNQPNQPSPRSRESPRSSRTAAKPPKPAKPPMLPKIRPNVPRRCQREKGRDLCLYSLTENKMDSPAIKGVDDDDDDVKSYHDFSNVDKFYYTNMYVLSKWSKFIRELYRNNTLNNFCTEMDDGTHILGVPATSKVIEQVVMSINTEDDELTSPYAGCVEWVNFENVMDAMDIANFLQIEDILAKCSQVIEETFPIKIGENKDAEYCQMSGSNDVYSCQQRWRCKIKAIDKFNMQSSTDSTPDLLSYVAHLFVLMNYLQNQEFNWSKAQFLYKDHIQRLLVAILHVKIDLVPMDKKIKLFHQYVKPGDYAFDLFFQITFALCSNSDNKAIPEPTYQVLNLS